VNRFAITPIGPSQHESFIDLLLELHAYYVDPPTATRADARAHLLTHLLDPSSPMYLAVAADENGQVIGFAALVLLYSLVEPGPEDRRQCVMKELYVRSACRGMGVGEALVRWAAKYAVDHGCGRMDWNVKASNHRGIAFYESLGGVQVEDRLSFRLSRPALEALAGRGA